MHTFAGGFRTDSDDYKNMEKKRHIKVAGVLFFVWTAVILYGSLSPGDDLPPMGWLARIPHFDKIVHFCFYLGHLLLMLLSLQPSRGHRIWVAMCAIIFSGTIELLQGEYFDRSADWLDFAANSAGALAGIPLARLAERLIFKCLTEIYPSEPIIIFFNILIVILVTIRIFAADYRIKPD